MGRMPSFYMSQGEGMRLIAIITLLAFSQLSWGTMTDGTTVCPVQFNGRAKEIIEDVGPSTAYSTIKVVFINQQTLKGDVKEQVIVEVLKHGPFTIEPGEDYQVQLRNGR